MIAGMKSSSTMTISRAVSQLSEAYIALIKSGKPLKRFPSVMLWGAPGVGKSQGVRQIASMIEEQTGKRVDVTDVRLLLFNPVDLRGIPTANADKTLAVWLKPKIFQMDDSDGVVNILFLDEISAAPQSVQAAAYQITLDRTVGEHRLPENCIVIAAGNRVTDRSVAYAMPKALANRLCHFEITTDTDSWHDWAVQAGIHGKVISFLDYKPGLLMGFNTGTADLSFATPRSWEMVSNILNDITDDVGAVLPLIAGCIGDRVAGELLMWSESYNSIPSVEEIFTGEEQASPSRPESLYALSSLIVSYARDHHSENELNNVIAYVGRLPAEFKNRIFDDLLKIRSIRRPLSNNRVFDYWFARSGRYWEDYGL